MRRGPVSATGVGGTSLRASYVEAVGTVAGTYGVTAGSLRVGYGVILQSTASDGTTQIPIIQCGVSGSSEVQVGHLSAGVHFRFTATDLNLYDNTTIWFNHDGTFFNLRTADFGWAGSVSNPRLYQGTAANGSGNPLTIRSRGSTGAGNAGSDIRIQAGRPGAGGAAGVGRLQGNRDDSTFDDAFVWSTSGSAATCKLYGGTPIVQQTDVGAAPTDTVANLAAWAETLRTRVRNIGITA